MKKLIPYLTIVLFAFITIIVVLTHLQLFVTSEPAKKLHLEKKRSYRQYGKETTCRKEKLYKEFSKETVRRKEKPYGEASKEIARRKEEPYENW